MGLELIKEENNESYKKEVTSLVVEYYTYIHQNTEARDISTGDFNMAYNMFKCTGPQVKDSYKSNLEYFTAYYPMIVEETVASIIQETNKLFFSKLITERIRLISKLEENNDSPIEPVTNKHTINAEVYEKSQIIITKDGTSELSMGVGDIVIVAIDNSIKSDIKYCFIGIIINASEKNNMYRILVTDDKYEYAGPYKSYQLVWISNIISSKREYVAICRLGRSSIGKLLMAPESIIKLEKPEKSIKTVKPEHMDSYYEKLNEVQKSAIEKSLNRKITLIQGPPGTGKTLTIACLIAQLIRQGLKVLVCAPSNMAVSMLVQSNSPWEWLFTKESCWIHVYSERIPDKSNKPKTRIDMYNRTLGKISAYLDGTPLDKKDSKLFENMGNVRLVFSTLSMSGSATVEKMAFDVVIIDEACQSIEPSSIIPMQKALSHVILVGDPMQLPATVLSGIAKLSISLFERLSTVMCPILLNTQYRMHNKISHFPSKAFYNGRLINGVSLNSVLPIAFVNVNGMEKKQNRSICNQMELCTIKKLLPHVMNKYKSAAIITPYKEQHKIISTDSTIAESGITVTTVDGFQGQEKDCIIISTVRTNAMGFLSDCRRMNVALTRAKYTVIVVGSIKLLSKDEIWNDFIIYLYNISCVYTCESVIKLLATEITDESDIQCKDKDKDSSIEDIIKKMNSVFNLKKHVQ
ncbi:regulator of nonsense transcripts 1 [Nematocida sp. AWRm78]|nr:regulator of nonsense transcripts 1 [Nematocida sp. AWRm79]KAI5183427.1 regulator of nonsense transcripts 1 [Nematocida sp. AWRm78]